MKLFVTQEQILQYSEARAGLLKNDVKFALISIGMPDTGIKLCNHLGIENGEEWIFADPENSAYDQLRLNKGWNTMISPATAFRFRDRIFGGSKGGSLDRVSRLLLSWIDISKHYTLLCCGLYYPLSAI